MSFLINPFKAGIAPPWTVSDLLDLVAWYRAEDEGAGAMAQWDDLSGNGNDLVQATGAKQPVNTAAQLDGKAAAIFDGADDFMAKAFTLVQPAEVWIIYKPISWASADSIFDGFDINGIRLAQYLDTPDTNVYVGSWDMRLSDATIGVFHLERVLSDGAASEHAVDGAAPETGDPGANDPNGFTLGSQGTGANPSNIAVAEVFILSAGASAADKAAIYDYLDRTYYTLRFPSLPNLVGRWRADTVVEGAIATWDDISGNGNDLVQATGAKQPIAEPRQINNKPAVVFDGVDDFMLATFALVQPEEVWIIMNPIGWTNLDAFWDGAAAVNSMGLIQYGGVSPAIQAYAGNDLTELTAMTIGSYHLLKVLYDGASSEIVVDGGAATTGDVGSEDGGGFRLGEQNTPDRRGNIAVAEVFILSAAATPQERGEIRQYIVDRYALTIAAPVFPTVANLEGRWRALDEAEGVLASWTDLSGNDNHLLQATGSKQPINTLDQVGGRAAVIFDGVDDFMTDTFTLAQPSEVWIVFMRIAADLYGGLFDGGVSTNMLGYEQVGNQLGLHAGSNGPNSGALSTGIYHVAKGLFDGASSKLVIDNGTPVTGDVGADDAGGFSLGAWGNETNHSNSAVAEAFVLSAESTTIEQHDIIDYLNETYLLDLTQKFHPADLADLVGWWRAHDEALGAMAQWDDLSGNDNHLVQATGAKQPVNTAAQINGKPAVIFDGVDDFMDKAFTLIQPEEVWIVFNQISWAVNDRFFDGDGLHGMGFFQGKSGGAGSSPNVATYAGAYGPEETAAATVANWHLARVLFNGASSELSINNAAPTTGNVGGNNANGFTLCADGGGGTPGNIAVAEVFILSAAADGGETTDIINYINEQYDLSL